MEAITEIDINELRYVFDMELDTVTTPGKDNPDDLIILPESLRFLLERITELERKVAEMEQEIASLKGKLEESERRMMTKAAMWVSYRSRMYYLANPMQVCTSALISIATD